MVLKPCGSPFFLLYLPVKDALPVLELNSKVLAPLNSIQPLKLGQVVGLGGFEPPTSRLSGVRSNQTEL